MDLHFFFILSGILCKAVLGNKLKTLRKKFMRDF